MRILIAEDDPITRRILEVHLGQWGYEVVAVANGALALQALEGPEPPAIAIVDWMMPEMDGPDVCRRIRQVPSRETLYVILLTGRDTRTDLLAGLEAGADDYLVKPFDAGVLRARLGVASRLLQLQASLAERVRELEEALVRVKQLQGLLPICAWCKKIRDDQNYWQTVEDYVSIHTEARFTHGICPQCLQQQKDQLKK